MFDTLTTCPTSAGNAPVGTLGVTRHDHALAFVGSCPHCGEVVRPASLTAAR